MSSRLLVARSRIAGFFSGDDVSYSVMSLIGGFRRLVVWGRRWSDAAICRFCLHISYRGPDSQVGTLSNRYFYYLKCCMKPHMFSVKAPSIEFYRLWSTKSILEYRLVFSHWYSYILLASCSVKVF